MSRYKDTLQLIDELEQQVEAHLQEAIRVFQNMGREELLRPAENGGWSIAQCLWHLNSYAHYYVPRIREALNKAFPANPVFKSSMLGAYFKAMMEPGETGRKYKAHRDHVPPGDPDAYAVVADFIQQQEQLLDCLRQARHADLDAVKIPLSISKWIRLKPGDILQFMVVHDERHIRQARKNISMQG
jgi:uncharacterized damage-inducible protein DinB